MKSTTTSYLNELHSLCPFGKTSSGRFLSSPEAGNDVQYSASGTHRLAHEREGQAGSHRDKVRDLVLGGLEWRQVEHGMLEVFSLGRLGRLCAVIRGIIGQK